MSKGCKIKLATVFTSLEDIRLKCFTVISDCLIKDWYSSLKNMLNNENNNVNLEIESHDYSIILFIENEELRNESGDGAKLDASKDNISNSNNKSGRKTFLGDHQKKHFFL